MASNFELKFFPNAEALCASAAGNWLGLMADESNDPFSVALSGGRIAKTFFIAVAKLAKSQGTSLSNVHFFWADERCLPPTDAESNFRLAQDNLLGPSEIAPEKIHRLKGEVPPAEALAEASRDIRETVSIDSNGMPVLDLVFLGIGEDGHTASLMPNAPAEVRASREPYVHVSNSPKPPPNRLSMSYPVLAAARNVWALIAGAGKEEPLRNSLQPGGKTPFGRVLECRRQSIIYTDLNEKALALSK
jgi:6-phosphogluconolactonase